MRISEAAWGLTESQRLQVTLRALRDGSSDKWTLNELGAYLRHYKRNSERTVQCRLGQLAFMARHPIAPVKLDGTRAELIETFSVYITAREEIENVAPTGLVGDHKAIRALGAFLSIPENVWPTAPNAPRTTSRWVPSPEQVYDLLQAKYGPRGSYVDYLMRYMLGYCFGIGVRPPSELWTARVSDVDLDTGCLVITERKKSGSRRELLVTPRWLVDSPNRLSLKRWIEGPRNLCDPKTDALFPNLDGHAFATPDALRVFLLRQVQGDPRSGKPARFEWYSPYISRHWSCNARLIDSAHVMSRRRVYDWPAVARWHGHESLKMTMSTYARAVELNEARHGRNWLTRAFGRPQKRAQHRKRV